MDCSLPGFSVHGIFQARVLEWDAIAFSVFSRFYIIFTIITLNYFHLSLPLLFGLVGIYPVPFTAGYFSAFSSCLDCYVWGGLSVFWQFVVPLYCCGPPCGCGWTSDLSRFPG